MSGRIGYGLLTFEIFGYGHLADHTRFPEASREYAKCRYYDEPMNRPQLTNCLKLFGKQLLLEFLAGSIFPDPFTQAIDEAIATLDDRYKMLLEFRYGLPEGIPITKTETAKLMPNMKTGHTRVSQSAVSQMEQRAIRRLRQPENVRKIKTSLDDAYLRDLFGLEPLIE